MVLWACAPGAALVPEDVAVVVVDVDVDVDVLLSEPQPTSAKLSATVMVAAAMCHQLHLPKIGPTPAPATPERH
jgi:hypothetical protein